MKNAFSAATPARRWLATGALAFVLPLASLTTARAQDAKPADTKPADAQSADVKTTDMTPQIWTIKYTKGATSRVRQRATITGDAGGNEINILLKAVTKRDVKDVAENGDATIATTTESRALSFNGMDLPDDPSSYPVVTQTVSSKGLLVKQSIENSQQGGEALEKALAMVSQTPVPDKPVKPGDTWKTDIDNRFVEGKKVTVTSTLIGSEKVSGIDTVRVKTEMAIPPTADATDKNLIKVVGFINVDPKVGRVVRSEYNLDNVTLSLGGNEVTVKGKLSGALIVPGVNDKEDAPKAAAAADTKKP